MAKPVTVSNGRYAGVTGAAELQAAFARLPDVLHEKVQAALDESAEQLVETYRQLAPVAPEFESHPGQMRDSAHVEHPAGRPLSVAVVVDAKDAEGRFYPSFSEFGHKTEAGAHVPGRPALNPAYRQEKPAIQRRVRAATKAAIADLDTP